MFFTVFIVFCSIHVHVKCLFTGESEVVADSCDSDCSEEFDLIEAKLKARVYFKDQPGIYLTRYFGNCRPII